jgi:hypothetical protein
MVADFKLMGIVLDLVWGTKVLITGYNTYRLCFGDSGISLICGASGFYLSVLVIATVCSWKCLPSRKELTEQEPDTLRLIEEGFHSPTGNPKQD